MSHEVLKKGIEAEELLRNAFRSVVSSLEEDCIVTPNHDDVEKVNVGEGRSICLNSCRVCSCFNDEDLAAATINKLAPFVEKRFGMKVYRVTRVYLVGLSGTNPRIAELVDEGVIGLASKGHEGPFIWVEVETGEGCQQEIKIGVGMVANGVVVLFNKSRFTVEKADPLWIVWGQDAGPRSVNFRDCLHNGRGYWNQGVTSILDLVARVSVDGADSCEEGLERIAHALLGMNFGENGPASEK